ncbi:hypothetical protein [Oryzobacter terrae]|uniref:hypothetical protein n=1 Tax=Oryzobacter terrae TaxID=1620385 RepID=UPI00366BAEAD
MRRLAVILPLAALVAAGLTAVPAQAVPLPTSGVTAYSVDTGALPGAGWGTRFALESSAAGASGNALGGGGLTVGGISGGTFARVFVSPPTGGGFAVGTYDIREVATATEARVQIDGGTPAECSTVSGTLTVHEVALDAGEVTRFAGSVRGNCGEGEPVFAQEIRWNSTVPFIRLTAPVSTSTPSTTVTVAVPSTATFGQVIGSGTDAKVRVVNDGCSNRTVTGGTSCPITIAATPDFFGPAQDLLTLPDGGAGRKIPVTVVGYDTASGAYAPLSPARLLDTRRRVGIPTTTPLGGGRYVDLQVTSRGGVPSTGVSAVVLNVTVVAPTSQGYVTVYPTGTSKPTASSVNFNKGWTGANLLTVKVGTGGKVRIHNYAGNTHVVADVVGYYNAPTSTRTSGYGGYSGIEPARIADTRLDADPLQPGWYLTTGYDFGEFNPHITAFAVNITVTRPTGSGHLTAWDGEQFPAPKTSTLNFTAGRTVPNMAIVPTSECGADFCPEDPTIPLMGVLNTSNGNAHVVVDLVGVYDDNTLDGMWRFRPLAKPTRIVNTKLAQGINGAVGAGATKTVAVPDTVSTFNSMAVVTNTTANKPTKTTVLTLWNDDIARPGVSNLNPYAGQLVSNMTITDIGADWGFKVHNATGSTNLVIDVAGTMENYPAVADPGAAADLRADGVDALRDRAAQRATGDTRASAPHLTGTPVSFAPRQR